MCSPKESKEQKKPSSSEQQTPRENSPPQNTPGAQQRTGQNETNATGTGGNANTETKSSGGDNVKGQGGGVDPKNKKNVSQTEKGQVSGTSATAGGTSASILLTRKRERQGDPIRVGSSSGSGPKGKGEVPSCAICKKTFPSWRGVFGHLRAHPKPALCVFPPPTGTPEGSSEKKKNSNNNNNKVGKTLEEQLAPTLLSLACQKLQTVSQDSNASGSTGVASSSRRRGLDIDLNEPRTSVLLDTPPPEKDEDDDGDDHQK